MQYVVSAATLLQTDSLKNVFGSAVLGERRQCAAMAAQCSLFDPPSMLRMVWTRQLTLIICRKAVSAMDLSAYILASFATVEDVRQALNPANFTVVNFHLSDSAMAVLIEAGLLAPRGHPFIHLGINDAKHDSLVIEFIEGEANFSHPCVISAVRSHILLPAA